MSPRALPIWGVLLCAFLLSACVGKNETDQPKAKKEHQVVRPLSNVSSLYSGNPKLWRDFLNCWRNEVGLGAIDEAVAADNFESAMPPSYRHFLQTTNGRGFEVPRTPANRRAGEDLLFPYSDVGKFSTHPRLRETWKAWNDNKTGTPVPDKSYYDFTRDQDPVAFREEYLNDLVAIGELEGGTALLLNPRERTSDGEFEAWYMSTRLPGAYRFRSFAELMQAVYFMETRPLVSLYDVRPEHVASTCAGPIFTHFRKS